MRQNLWSATFVGIVSAVSVGLLAQTPPPSSSTQAAKPITLSGCVERAPSDTTTPPAAAPAAGAMSAKFVLTNAAAPASGAGAVGTTGSTMKPASKYQLDVDDAKITAHVGHKVEVTGTIDEPSSTSSAAASAASPKFKVDSVKMVAATCP
jgi:hypothetical protein